MNASKFFKILLLFTSFIPSFLPITVHGFIHKKISFLLFIIIIGIFISLFILLKIILQWARNHFQKINVTPAKIQSANRDMMSFLFGSLIPVLIYTLKGGIEDITSSVILGFFILGSIVYLTDSYYFNPLLKLLGLNMYQIEIEGIVYLLITRKKLKNRNSICIVKLNSYMLLAKDEKRRDI